MSALYLHETIDIVGQGSWPYMQHTLQASGNEINNFVLQGTWSVMGITGRWPQVINIWDVPNGWDGWGASVERLNLKRTQNTELNAWWDEAYKSRTGGFDRLLAGAPNSPTTASLVAAGVHGSLFVHEIATVRPGTTLEHLEAVAAVQVPLMAEYGFTATGLYETLMTDNEVITVWSGSVEAHTNLQRAKHASRHRLPAGDDRLGQWRRTAREFVTDWRSELMTPCPGITIGPEHQ
ncbi:MAG: hypothetical protein F2659_02605 [Actinobacteria bacterium]|nr:hypothetical protein [Actinomycetota bacterium]